MKAGVPVLLMSLLSSSELWHSTMSDAAAIVTLVADGIHVHVQNNVAPADGIVDPNAADAVAVAAAVDGDCGGAGAGGVDHDCVAYA